GSCCEPAERGGAARRAGRLHRARGGGAAGRQLHDGQAGAPARRVEGDPGRVAVGDPEGMARPAAGGRGGCL
ncbi:MAG: hypothetical protein AVDCRST_MAG19-4964, partial [uncultured Thermomicrobiales bacterium]